ncbi:hypothetical protein CYLTODRAFT_416591 [Cylindrobasidium torrendii FP15055 ss-10]|uniref:Uncharacterized protein n=1 Tax=Cylindrobasidium torrendii FP15055 ss-10 TaxID=1314674 RepID=A0A0D7BUS8_9AGAR|nr:hypothetical protein CYLTODRAFT_416591 [Cylindrobasidium torrendii FP15055 ss-10]
MPEFGFDVMSVPDLHRYSLVCYSAYVDVDHYFNRGHFFHRGLRRWFSRSDCLDLRYCLESVGGLLSGSSILSMFAGEDWDGPMSLRLHVPHARFPEVVDFLRERGYVCCNPTEVVTPWAEFKGLSPSNTVRAFLREREGVRTFLFVVRCYEVSPLHTVLECASVPTMCFMSCGRICCMARDWVCSRTVPLERDLLSAPDNPTASLRRIGWRLRSAENSLHFGRSGGPRQLFDDLCSSYRFSSGPTDELEGFSHRWADVVLAGGRFRAEVTYSHREPTLCRDPLYYLDTGSRTWSVFLSGRHY